MRFHLLGPVEVLAGGAPIPISAAKHRIVLATLLLHNGRTVTTHELIDRLWDGEPPEGARATLRAYVMRLRHALGTPDLIATVNDGYRAEVDPRSIDVYRFYELLDVAKATAAEDPRHAEKVITEALGLWRGPALVDVPSESLSANEVVRLTEHRLEAAALGIEIGLRLGKHHELITELRGLTAENPLHEQFWCQLMLALYRANRQAEALGTYQLLSKLLAEELGIDPSPEARDLHTAILANDPSLSASGRQPSQPHLPTFQLPPSIANFVGRSSEGDRLAALLAPDGENMAVPVVTVSGPPGVGKTALAIRLAHEVRHRFPDGQLFVDLRAYASAPALSPAEVLPRLLRALGVPPKQVPVDEDEQISLYRSQLAGRRVLIVLDNAASPGQVRPLLPGEPGCAVLITSRNALRGLIVLQGASPLRLDVLDAVDSRALLSGILGDDAVAAEPAASAELAKLCAHLPLALRIAAGNLASRPESSIADYVATLRKGNLLAALAVEDDEEAAVHAAFDLSYEALSPPDRRMFRLLALVPGPELGTAAAASLAGVTQQEAAALLNRLTSVNLIQQHGSGRFHCHELLRSYAHQRARDEDGPELIDAAVQALYDHYLRTSAAAVDLLSPTTQVRLPRPPSGAGIALLFGDRQQALEWLNAERSSLVAAVIHAADNSPTSMAWYLADVLSTYFIFQRHNADAVTTAQAGWRAAQRMGDAEAEAVMTYCLGTTHLDLSDYDNSVAFLKKSIRLFRSVGSVDGEAAAVSALSAASIKMGAPEHAAVHATEALALATSAGASETVAKSLFRLGAAYLFLARFEEAADCLLRALTCFERLGSWHGEAACRNNLGYAYRELGRFVEATSELTRSLRLRAELSSRDGKFDVLDTFAGLHLATGDLAQAADYAQEAAALAARAGDQSSLVDSLTTLAAIDHGRGLQERAFARCRKALDSARSIGYQAGEIAALVQLAKLYCFSAAFSDARTCCRKALTVGMRAGIRLHEVSTLSTLATAELGLGRINSAMTHAAQAVIQARLTRQRLEEGRALLTLGAVHSADGRRAAAREQWQLALEIFAELGAPDASQAVGLLAAD